MKFSLSLDPSLTLLFWMPKLFSKELTTNGCFLSLLVSFCQLNILQCNVYQWWFRQTSLYPDFGGLKILRIFAAKSQERTNKISKLTLTSFFVHNTWFMLPHLRRMDVFVDLLRVLMNFYSI